MKKAINVNKKRNILLIVLCFFIYVSCYFLKLGYSANIVNIEQDFGVSHSNAGLVSTFFFIAYGAGNIINGFLVKKYNLKIIVPSVLFVSAVINLSLFFIPSSLFYLIKYLWLVNGLLMSVMWPATVRFVSENINKKYSSKAILTIGFTTPVGTGIVYGLSSLLSYLKIYRLIFIVGVLAGFIAIILWFVLYEKVLIQDDQKELVEEQEKQQSNKSFTFLLFVGIICLFCLITDFSKEGLQTWLPSILKEKYSFDDSLSILLTLLFPIGNFIGTFIAVQANKAIKNYVSLCTIFLVLTAIVIGIDSFYNNGSALFTIIVMTVTSLFLSAVISVVTSLIPIDWAKYKNSGLYAGLFNGFCYVGSAIATYTFGLLADNIGWDSTINIVIYILAGTGLIGAIDFVYHAIEKKRRLSKKEN